MMKIITAAYKTMSFAANPYGDGLAAEKIVREVLKGGGNPYSAPS